MSRTSSAPQAADTEPLGGAEGPGEVPGERSQTTKVPPEWIARQGPVILDASFVLAVLDGDPRVARHDVCLPGSVLLSVNLGEVFAKTHLRTHLAPRPGLSVTAQIEHWLTVVGVRLVDLPVAAMHHLPRLVAIDQAAKAAAKAQGLKRKNLSLADRSILGYALHTGLPVLTGDQDWSTLGTHGLTVQVFQY